MGTTMFYVLMSMKPQYNAKIRHMVALAPVAFLKNTKSLFAVATKFIPKGVSAPVGSSKKKEKYQSHSLRD
jgi:hypothetical protein